MEGEKVVRCEGKKFPNSEVMEESKRKDTLSWPQLNRTRSKRTK